MHTLNASDITAMQDEVGRHLAPRLKGNMPSTGQAFEVDFLPALVSRVLVPIVVSLCSRALYDVLKGKILGSLTKKQADRLVRGISGTQIQGPEHMEETCLAELRRELLPLGITEGQMQDLYGKIRQHLLRGESQTQSTAS